MLVLKLKFIIKVIPRVLKPALVDRINMLLSVLIIKPKTIMNLDTHIKLEVAAETSTIK